MMDECDLAVEREEYYRDIAILRARAALSGEDPLFDGGGRRICVECMKRIPPKRLTANPQAVRCVACQAEKERGENGMA